MTGAIVVAGALAVALSLLPVAVMAQATITEIIDNSGDGAGNLLDYPQGIAVDGLGNVYVTGSDSDNVFRITPAGTITEIIDAFGDGAGSRLTRAFDTAVDGTGNVYVTGVSSDNAFRITPAGTITEIIDLFGDGAGNPLNNPYGVAVDDAGNVYVSGTYSHSAFKITAAGTITEIIDGSGDGAGNLLNNPSAIAVDDAGNVYVTGILSNNAFRITPSPFLCEVATSQRTYILGETLELATLRFANLSAGPLLTRLRLQLLFVTLFTADILDVGADGTFGLPAGFDHDFGPKPLFNVQPIMPQGTWSMRCALEHPASGVVQAEGFFPFDVE